MNTQMAKTQIPSGIATWFCSNNGLLESGYVSARLAGDVDPAISDASVRYPRRLGQLSRFRESSSSRTFEPGTVVSVASQKLSSRFEPVSPLVNRNLSRRAAVTVRRPQIILTDVKKFLSFAVISM